MDMLPVKSWGLKSSLEDVGEEAPGQPQLTPGLHPGLEGEEVSLEGGVEGRVGAQLELQGSRTAPGDTKRTASDNRSN
eukprot:4377337-Pyramimonas_sp.AAC.1